MKHRIVMACCLAGLLCLAACGEGQQRVVLDEKLKRELQLEEPRQIRPGEVQQAAYVLGDSIAGQLFTLLYQDDAGELDGLPTSLCHNDSLPFLDSVAAAYGVVIKRFVPYSTGPEADETEALLLDAYAYQIEQGQESLKDNVQDLGTEVLFTKPIAMGDALCQHCAQYEEGETPPYAGCGMWSIHMPKKAVIYALSQQD